MKRFLAIILVLTMALSMAACGCDHQAGSLQLTSVDTENLTISWELPCSICGEVLETQQTGTGIAPADGKMRLSPDQWYNCLTTQIKTMGASQTLIPYPMESEDNALLHGVVSVSGMLAVYSFWDADGNVLTTEQRDAQDQTHCIRIDGQFTNDTATDFFMLLMLTVIGNNSELDLEAANTLCAQIMSGNPATDNGYSYQMSIISVEDHTVRVDISADA